MKKLFVIAMAFLATTTAFAQSKDSVATKDIAVAKDTVGTPSAVTGKKSHKGKHKDKAAAKDAAPKAVVAAAPVTSAPVKPKVKDWSKINLSKRPNDHFMFQLGYDNWAGKPDSIHIKGFNRSVNVYFMFDFPFKTDPRFSIGAGLGFGCSNVFFDKQQVRVADNSPTLGFPYTPTGDHFKKNKLVTTYFEAPLELRFALDPENTNKSWKFAVGAKVGLMLSAYSKGKTYQNGANQTTGNYTVKFSDKQFFNSTKLAATARISKGVFGVFGQYQLNALIKSNAGPAVYPFSFGFMVSGL
ncbi:outer membrane beta-barrel protein [Flavitalea flava]